MLELNKNRSDNMKKKLLFIAALSTTIFLTGCGNGKPVLEYKYEDSNVPGTNYEIKLYENMTLKVNETPHCNYEKCKDKTEKRTISISEDEYNTIIEVTKEDYSKEILSQALSAISKDKKIMASIEKDGKDNWAKLYQKEDTNNDGRLSYKEHGDYLLNTLTKGEE